jgi:hypothetical protein
MCPLLRILDCAFCELLLVQMSHHLALSEILNPLEAVPAAAASYVDVQPHLKALATLVEMQDPIHVPVHVAKWLSKTVNYFRAENQLPTRHTSGASLPTSSSHSSSHQDTPVHLASLPPSPTHFSPVAFPSAVTSAVRVMTDVKLNHVTTLSHLYIYEDIHACIEYPKMSEGASIGHLFLQDPENWQDPSHNFAYSLGLPSGHTKGGEEVTCLVLHEKGNDSKLVPCVQHHFTCM